MEQPGSLIAWARHTANDASLKDDGPLKPRAKQMVEKVDTILARIAASQKREAEIDDQIAVLEEVVAKLRDERRGMQFAVDLLGEAVPATPKAKRQRSPAIISGGAVEPPKLDPTGANGEAEPTQAGSDPGVPAAVTPLRSPLPPAPSRKRETMRHPPFSGDDPKPAA